MPEQLENNGTQRLAITDAAHTVSHIDYITAEEVEKRTAKEAYYCWLSRLIMLLAVLSLGFFASASLVLFRLAPEVTVEPFLIMRQDNSETMVRSEVISPNMASANQMMETFVRQYITLRNAIVNDEREMQSRWLWGGMLSYLSSGKVFTEFEAQAQNQIKNARTSNLVRDVEIISVSKAGGEKSPVWKVDFRTYDLSPENRNEQTGAMVLVTRYWTASVTAFFVPERMFMTKRLMNPLGFTVTRYSQAEVEIL